MALSLSALAAGGASSEHLPVFTDTTESSGVRFHNENSATPEKYLIETMTGGVAMIDYDNDGWPDLFFVNGARIHSGQKGDEPADKSDPRYWNRLYRNNHDGTFTDVTEKAGVKGTGFGMGAAVADYDNDGFDDLLVTNFGGVILYHNNGDGTFREVTAQAGLGNVTGWASSAGFFDYDNDGRLDLFIGRYLDWDYSKNVWCGSRLEGGRSYCHPDNFKPIANYLFHNNGNGTFTDVSAPSGIAATPGKALGVAFADFNNDNRLDIAVANDSMQQFIFMNQGNGRFAERAVPLGAGYTDDGKVFAGMGIDAADVDDDGYPDIVTTALSNETYAYFHNDRGAGFDYDTPITRLGELTRLLGGWGMRVFDYDNDGTKDLFFANSHVMDNVEKMQPHLEYRQPLLLLRQANHRFVNVSGESGPVFQEKWASRGAAFGDLDNDGDIDIAISVCGGSAHILRNDGGNRNGWIGLILRGVRSNRDGIGARVKLVTAAGHVEYGMVTTTASYQSAQDKRLLFGLGAERTVARVEIAWPGGHVQTIEHPPAGRYITIIEK
jgi:hypothetical protein